MLNNYMWHMYLKSGGSKIVELFENNLKNEFSEDYAEQISALHKAYCPSKAIIDELREELEETYRIICEGVYVFESGEYSLDSAVASLYDELVGETESDNDAFVEFSDSIAYYTTLFSIELPELFVPYYYKFNFNVLEMIADEFGIILPELPVKKDYKGRFFYYARLCEVFYDFRTENGMTPYEFCAFLYDFAPKYIGGIDSYIIKDLPPAKSAYFIGGEKDDPFLFYADDTITLWQCNPETAVGDNIVMYLKTPISAIDSIWRSVSIGFNDPFFYYYRCAYIANPEKIKKITLKTLERDKILKKLPIVRKNMQGLNGVEISPSVYNHLIELSKTDLPRLEFWTSEETEGLQREKDVEEKLIKPFLSKLGYSEEEYTQQLHIHVGNNNFKLIPDFVIHPNITKGHHSADFIIEAKYTVASAKELEIYKDQARSYANQLKVKYSVIASKEGIWVSSYADDFSEDFIVFSWSELRNEDSFHEVLKVIGNTGISKAIYKQEKIRKKEMINIKNNRF